MTYLTAIIPSVGVLFLFVVAIRAMFQADQRERLAQAKLELQARARTERRDSGENGVAGGEPGKS